MPSIGRRRTLRPTREDAEQGSITVFAVLMTAVFVIVAGLLVDGGLALAGKTAAITDAQDAARAAETAVSASDLRHGALKLNPADAATAAYRYLAAAGDAGTVQIHGTEVHVVARRTVRTQILRLVGVGSLTETGTATAQLEPGISRPFDLATPQTGSGAK
ncbi:TadE/TadG family type IV pilus assembly protein [Actinospica robiniae]|uniref:TadE/TadG family type IV pilus assembly protein n=1 Tax=Actinospica robiniae TaxID=304901 RepID=UPI0004285230|nr:hypothetical protein [Actinospica robiniae]